MTEPTFEETQRAAPGIVALIVGIVLAADALAFATMPAGTGTGAKLLLLLPLALAVALLAALRMKTRVDSEGLQVRIMGLFRRRFPLGDIATAKAVRYRPIRDFGGWGIRWSRKGMAYNMRGDRGVQLVLANGKLVLIGSQRAEALSDALHSAGVS